MDLDLDKHYKKAVLKEKGPFYVITFTGPLTKDDPKKTVVKIVKATYYLQEVESKVGGQR